MSRVYRWTMKTIPTPTPLKRSTPKSTTAPAKTKSKQKAFLITDRPVKNTLRARVEANLDLNNDSRAPRRSATSL